MSGWLDMFAAEYTIPVCKLSNIDCLEVFCAWTLSCLLLIAGDELRKLIADVDCCLLAVDVC